MVIYRQLDMNRLIRLHNFVSGKGLTDHFFPSTSIPFFSICFSICFSIRDDLGYNMGYQRIYDKREKTRPIRGTYRR